MSGTGRRAEAYAWDFAGRSLTTARHRSIHHIGLVLYHKVLVFDCHFYLYIRLDNHPSRSDHTRNCGKCFVRRDLLN